MAYRNRRDYTRHGAEHSRYNGRPGPWHDQYRYYDDHDHTYGRQDYYDAMDYREPYNNYGYTSAGGYSNYSQSYPYQSYTNDYTARDFANGSVRAYGEHRHHATSSSGGYRESYDSGPSHWAGHEAQDSEAYQESSIHAPERLQNSAAPSSYYGQTREYHSYNASHDSRHDDTRNHSYHEQSRPRSRERARSPPPPPPPPPRAPSPAYIDLAEQPPSPVASPSDARKLLILDLNGTLVFRSAYRPKGKSARPRDDKPHGDAAASTEEPADAAPRLRSAHPRPYAPAFRAYLFAPQTRAWLDVMVWSSAQPHSVRGMVERVFGADVYAEATRAGGARDRARPRLLAIWARDTLGLSESHYRQKVQTIKDLNIVWSRLPKLTRGDSPSRASPPPSSSPRSSPQPHHTRSSSPLAPSPPRATVHSALSTLLLDDSPAKAARQPYNHVCLPEYDGRARARDLAVFTRERDARELAEAQRELDENGPSANVGPEATATVDAVDAAPACADEAADPAPPAEPRADTDPAADPAADAEADDDRDATRKRKRQEKKARRRQEKLAKAAAQGTAAAPGAAKPEEGEDEYDPTLLAVVGVLDAVKREANVAAWVRAGGLWRGAGADAGAERGGDGAVQGAEGAAAGAALEADGRSAESRKRVRYRSAGAAAGNDAAGADESAADPTVQPRDAQERPQEQRTKAAEEGGGAPMWFEDAATLRYWVERGRRALEELGIPVEHGIER